MFPARAAGISARHGRPVCLRVLTRLASDLRHTGDQGPWCGEFPPSL